MTDLNPQHIAFEIARLKDLLEIRTRSEAHYQSLTLKLLVYLELLQKTIKEVAVTIPRDEALKLYDALEWITKQP